ncbi:MAG: YwaF family protein [Clostridia bacterium]|nr:YwaF family protein [Clostridia bacterium]
MFQYIMLFSSIILALILTFALNAVKEKSLTIKNKTFNVKNSILQIISVALFFIYIPHLFNYEVITNQLGLEVGMFDKNTTIFLVVLRWLLYLTNAILIVMPFFNKKGPVYYSVFFAPIFIVLNWIFFDKLSLTITGSTELSKQIIIYAIVMVINSVIVFNKVFDFIFEKDYSKIHKKVLHGLAYGLFYLMAFMPINSLQILFGSYGQGAKNFTVIHRIYIYLSFIIPFILYFLFRNKSMSDRRHLLIMLSLSGFMQFFFNRTPTITSMPLHLCNTAIIIMFFVYVFKAESAFYFTYFVNVPGAFFAIIMPNGDAPFTTFNSLLYWYNHWYAFFLPLLGVALKLFKRPSFNMIKKAIPAFGVYVILAALLNGYINNLPQYVNSKDPAVDYFFLYDNFLINMLPWAYPLKRDFILSFPLGEVTVKIFWLYVLLVFIVFIGFMFITWGIYQIFFNLADGHKALFKKKTIVNDEMHKLIVELNGRPLSEPLHPEGVDMIKIKNFSKRYDGSDRYAVKNLNLEIHGGEVFGFIGHNGAGKSTTIKSLVGVQTITEGSIEIEGYDISRQPLEAKLNIGFVSDNHAVYEQLTGREYVEYIADLYKVKKEDKEKTLLYYSDMFGLTNFLDCEIKSYSHGMKQKISVISSLIHNPKVWVLDEPFTGLDPTSTYQIKECMREHAKKGNIVFFSSHVIEVVEKMCDRVAIICAGELCLTDTVENIKNKNLSVEELYLKFSNYANAKAVNENSSK